MSQEDSANAATVTDNRDAHSCNACVASIPAGETFFQLRFRSQYVRLCRICASDILKGLRHGMDRIKGY